MLALCLTFVYNSGTEVPFHMHQETIPYPSLHLHLNKAEKLTVSFVIDADMSL